MFLHEYSTPVHKNLSRMPERAKVYIDCQNVSHHNYIKILARLLEKHFIYRVSVNVYGNWSDSTSSEQPWLSVLNVPGITAKRCDVTSKKKDAADCAMQADMLKDSASDDDIVFVIVTSDKGFRETVVTLQNTGRYVIGIGKCANNNNPISICYDQFIRLEELNQSESAAMTTVYKLMLANANAKNEVTVRMLAEANRKNRTLDWEMKKVIEEKKRVTAEAISEKKRLENEVEKVSAEAISEKTRLENEGEKVSADAISEKTRLENEVEKEKEKVEKLIAEKSNMVQKKCKKKEFKGKPMR